MALSDMAETVFEIKKFSLLDVHGIWKKIKWSEDSKSLRKGIATVYVHQRK